MQPQGCQVGDSTACVSMLLDPLPSRGNSLPAGAAPRSGAIVSQPTGTPGSCVRDREVPITGFQLGSPNPRPTQDLPLDLRGFLGSCGDRVLCLPRGTLQSTWGPQVAPSGAAVGGPSPTKCWEQNAPKPLDSTAVERVGTAPNSELFDFQFKTS